MGPTSMIASWLYRSFSRDYRVDWGYIWIMENKMETSILGYVGLQFLNIRGPYELRGNKGYIGSSGGLTKDSTGIVLISSRKVQGLLSPKDNSLPIALCGVPCSFWEG